MEITITTRPAGSEQRAAVELLTSTPSALAEPWRRPVWTFTGTTEAAVPQNSSLNVLTLLWKITAEPSRQKSITDKKRIYNNNNNMLRFSSWFLLCLLSLFYCFIELLSTIDADTHHSFYKCVHPYYWVLYCTSNITPLTDTLTIL